MKRLLILSDEETHPQNSGRRTRLNNLLKHIVKHTSVTPVLVVINNEKKLSEETLNYWGDNAYHFPTQKNVTWSPHTTFWQKLKAKINQHIFNIKHQNISVDSLFDHKIETKLLDLHTKNPFDIIMSEYVFLSKYLNAFPASVNKVIDTHDIFSNRFEVFKKQNMPLPLFSISPKDEKKALKRADNIIAIQENDNHYFQSLLDQPKSNVSTIGFIYQPLNKVSKNSKKSILFLATATSWNLSAYDDIVKHVLPTLVENNIELIVAGAITSKITKDPHITYMGYVHSLEKLYNEVNIVLNPTSFGSGLKIKSIEALSYNKFVIGHEHAFHGLENINNAVIIENNPQRIGDQILKILNSPDLQDRLNKGIQNFNSSYYTKNISNLKRIFE